MMKKRLPLLPALIIGLAVAFLFGAITVWLKSKFELPDWIIPLYGYSSLFLVLEIAGRFGPPGSFVPSLTFLGLSIRDRIVTAAAFLASVLIAFPIGYRYDSLWFRFLFPALGVVAFWLICFIFGSKRLRQFVLLLLRKTE